MCKSIPKRRFTLSVKVFFQENPKHENVPLTRNFEFSPPTLIARNFLPFRH